MSEQIKPAVALATIFAAAGGRTRAFAAMRLAGFSNPQIALVVGNKGGAPTIAYALTNNLRKKAGEYIYFSFRVLIYFVYG